MRGARPIRFRHLRWLALAAALCACQARGDAGARLPGLRIVSLHDVTTELVVALGATPALVGVSEGIDLEAAVLAATRDVPRVAGTESVIAARPTLVLGMAVVAARAPELVAALHRRGTEVLLGEPRQLGDVFSFVTEVGARIGRRDAAEALAASLRREAGDDLGGPIASGEERASHRRPAGAAASDPTEVSRAGAGAAALTDAGRVMRVFVYDCCDPAFTAGARALLTDLLARAGGRNVFADLDVAWSKVSWEEAIARRPELVVVSDYAMGDQGDVADKRARLARLPGLAGLPVVTLPLGEALGGLRSVAGLLRLRRGIAAARVADVNLRAGAPRGPS